MGEKRVLDEATRKKLYGYVPFSTGAKVQFTPEQYNAITDATIRPIFQVRALQQGELIQLRQNLLSYNEKKTGAEIVAISENNVDVVCGCILGWVNLFDAGTGEEIEYKANAAGGCDREAFKVLPLWLVMELMEFIKKISGLTEPEMLSTK